MNIYKPMKRENLHQPFEITLSEVDDTNLKEHDHTFFELVYILTGTGIQWINNHKFPYHDGHLFLITPGDIHSLKFITEQLLSISSSMIFISILLFWVMIILRDWSLFSSMLTISPGVS